ncbi:MAG TPA: hypothetical protein VJ901_07430 [Thermoanaerobaculia bacterium]|nr:hypothetical protein [Thermoanaerobaculia bacterium]
MSLQVNETLAVTNRLELWKAIHGGCWPGPPIDQKLTEAAQEVVASLALLHIAKSFQDDRTATQITRIATERFNAAAEKVNAVVRG